MKWEKPSGIEIETNDMKETIEYCKSLGWKPLDIMTSEELMEAAEEAEKSGDMEKAEGFLDKIEDMMNGGK